MQLSSYDHLTPENIVFNEAKEYKVKDSKIKYKRIPIEVKYPNGKKGALVIGTPLLFSFGVNEKKNQETNKLVGYSMPVCLWAKDSELNTKEKAFFDVINNVTTLSQQHLENEYGADLASTLSSPFYFKQEEYTDKKGKKKTRIDSSSAPVLYAKLIYSEKSKKILSLFKGKGGKNLNHFKYIDQYCNVKMALIIEGIFISKTVTSLQIKVHECYVKPLKPRESLLTIEEELSWSFFFSPLFVMIDKITKAFTYAKKSELHFPSSFSLLSPEMRENSEISYFILNTICQNSLRLAKDYRAMGNFATPITENMKLINLQSSASFFFPRSRLTIHINSQVACEQALHLGESREVTREPHAKDDASFAAPSPVLSRLVSLVT